MKYFVFLMVCAIFAASAQAQPTVTSTPAISTTKNDSEIIEKNDDDTEDEDVSSRQKNRCSSTQFQCTNGQCISRNLLCNNRRDCRDGSDESHSLCRNSYTTEKYPGIPLQNQSNEGNQEASNPPLTCQNGEFICTSGECIARDLICNGYNDCQDGSDEAISLCPHNNENNNGNGQHSSNTGNEENNHNNNNAGGFCASNEFRCNSGECIFAEYECDGTRHCSDGSDEDWSRCQNNNGQTSATRPPPPSQTQPPAWQTKLQPCPVPRQPENGRWKLHRSLCNSNRECNAPANIHSMDPGSYLVFKCNDGFALKGSKDVLCGPNGVWVHEPTCEEIRCPDLSSSATEALCLWNNVAVSCEVPAPIGTTANLGCRAGFVQEVTYTQTYKNVTCTPEGKWSPRPITCVKKPKKVKLVLEGDMIISD